MQINVRDIIYMVVFMERIIMHIDVNNAFLSWSAVDLLNKGYNKEMRMVDYAINNIITFEQYDKYFNKKVKGDFKHEFQ